MALPELNNAIDFVCGIDYLLGLCEIRIWRQKLSMEFCLLDRIAYCRPHLL
jgi:hypothetical protein